MKASNDKYIRNEANDLLNQISKTIKRIPNLQKDENGYSVINEEDDFEQLEKPKDNGNNKTNYKLEIINKRVSAIKVLTIVAEYIKREKTSSRAVFGEHSTIKKTELAESLAKVAGQKVTELEISDTVDFLIASMYDSQQYQRNQDAIQNEN